jgi:hypothetical protein
MPDSTPSPTMNSPEATSLSYLATNWAPIYATLDKRTVKCDDGYQLELPEEVDKMSNEAWSIFTCSPVPKDHKTIWTPGVIDYSRRYTKLIKTDLSQSWIISHRDFSWSNRPNAYLSVRWWTHDGNYVYLVPAVSPSSSGFYAPGYFWDSSVLYRLNLISGEFETILPYAEKGYSFALSPNGQYLVYANPEEKKIVRIRDMISGDETYIELEENYVLTGAFVWKPDSTKLIFASAMNGWDKKNAGISIFKLSMKNMYVQTLLYNDRRLLIPFPQVKDKNLYYWTNENLLNVRSLDYMSTEYFNELALDIQTGYIVVLATAMPRSVNTAPP